MGIGWGKFLRQRLIGGQMNYLSILYALVGLLGIASLALGVYWGRTVVFES